MLNLINKKGSAKRKLILAVLLAIFLTLFSISVLSQEEVGGELRVDDQTLIFSRNDAGVRLDVKAIADGREQDISNSLLWWHEQRGEGWKFGANVTIPNTQQGQFFANNLEEIVFDIHLENAELGRVGERIKDGFHYAESCIYNENDLYKTCTYVDFDFSDIIYLFLHTTNSLVPVNIERDSPNDLTITFNVSGINFQQGSVIELDPTITIENVGTANAFLSNVTGENDLSHLSVKDSDLIFYTPLDTNISKSNVHDYTDYDSDLTIRNNAHYINEGKIGGAFEFDGDGDYLSSFRPTTLDFENTDSYTWTSWIKYQGFPATQQCFVSRDAVYYSKPTGYNLCVNNSVSGGDIVICRGHDTSFNLVNCSSGVGTSLSPNTWTHTAITYDGSSGWEVFIDGASQGTINFAVEDESWADFYIGAGSGYYHYRESSQRPKMFFNGTIDEVMVFNTSLSSTQISNLYNNQTNRFFTQGTQEFILMSILQSGGENVLNITIDPESNTHFNSSLEVRVGEVNTSDYRNILFDDPTKDNGLLYYHFDNLAGYENETHIFDFSGNDNNGTALGDAHPVSYGRYWSGFDFDGNGDYVEVNTVPLASGQDDFTISFWMNTTASGAFSGIYGEANTGDGTHYTAIRQSSNILYFYNYDGSTLMTCTEAGATPNDGMWHHVVAVKRASDDWEMFVDGESVCTSSTNSGTPTVDHVWVGSYDLGGTVYQYNGLIDDLLIFSKGFSAIEVGELYARGLFNQRYSTYTDINATNNVANFPLDTSTEYVLTDFRFNAGDSTDNTFYTPNLVKDVVLDSTANSCIYSSGNWNILCSENCIITSDVVIDSGSNISVTGSSGSLTINGANVTNYDEFVINQCEVQIKNIVELG